MDATEAMLEVQVRVDGRTKALTETMSAALSGCFSLLDQRLGEVESMVRTLQLVSVLVEVR